MLYSANSIYRADFFNCEKTNRSVCKVIQVNCDLQSNSLLKDVLHNYFLAKTQINWERKFGVHVPLEKQQ